MGVIYLPAVIGDLFGVSRSQARRAIATGGVRINGQIMTDLDVDVDAIPGDDEVWIELDRAEPRDSIIQILEAEQGRVDRA